MREKKREITAFLLALCALASVSYLAGWLLMPVRLDYGCTWESYRREARDSVDVLFFGSSLVYCDVIPAVIWEREGLTSYVMAGPEQTIPITYYYVREACRTQSPRAVVVEVTGMFYERYQNYTKVNIGYMPWSWNRLSAARRAAPRTELTGLLFPLYQYHDRWYQCAPGEALRHLRPARDPYAGYTLITSAQPAPDIVRRDFRADTDTYRENLAYLNRIAAFCAETDRKLILYRAPTRSEIPEEALTALRSDLAAVPRAAYYEFSAGADGLGINNDTDWYDYLHLNLHGAEKFSAAFARLLTDHVTASPDDDNAALWRARADRIHSS